MDTVKAAAPSGDGGFGKGRSEAPLDRVLRALNHPIRRGILRVLIDGSGSANTISKELGISLGVVSYHLRQVLAEECEVVELVKTVPRRGALEKFYRLRFQALTEGETGEGDSAQDDSPAPRAMSLEESFIVAVAAMDADAFEAVEGSAWDWLLAPVDPTGWQEIRDAGAAFNECVRAAVAKNRAPADESEAKEVAVGVAMFPALFPSSSAP
jgi:DNA-binding transcriptional ArsR family regulator